MDNFFSNNTFVIDEKVQGFKFANGYKVSNAEGRSIGYISENMPLSRKLLSLIISKKCLPLTLEVRNDRDAVIATLTRGWTFFMSTLQVMDEKGNQVGYIKQKFGLKAKLEVYDMQNHLIATLQGNWTAWDFTITDANGNSLGNISKKFNGLAKELFTDADKYVVTINPAVTNQAQRIAIASAATVIDLIFKEVN